MATSGPIELALARNLITNTTTPALLLIPGGTLIFFNEAAGALLGAPFEQVGSMPAEEWYPMFGPFNPDGSQTPFDQLAFTLAVRDRQEPAHAGRLYVKSLQDGRHEVEASVLPLITQAGHQGTIAFFWPVEASGT